MSVILYQDEKFQRIHSSLEYTRNLEFFFGYSAEDRDKNIPEFVQALCHANTEAYNERYRDSEKQALRSIHFKPILPYGNKIELLKALQSIEYNTIESVNYEETRKKLRDVIYFLMSEIIGNLEIYEKAQTW